MSTTTETALELLRDYGFPRERKFSFDDVQFTPALRPIAEEYASGYDGDFEFMVEMRTSWERRGYLSGGQAKGVLNCMRAQLLRDEGRAAEKAAAASDPAVASGRYAVDFDGELLFFVVRFVEDGRWAGYRFVDQQAGPNRHPVKGPRRAAVLAAIAVDPHAALVRYGRELGVCGVCGLELTDPESRAHGIGPVCRKKLAAA